MATSSPSTFTNNVQKLLGISLGAHRFPLRQIHPVEPLENCVNPLLGNVADSKTILSRKTGKLCVYLWKDFERNGLSKLVTVGVRDIQGEGFPQDLAGEVDAIFLDLPQPWTAVPSVINLLRGDAPICSFSPCIEQVQKTCEALTRSEFRDCRTFEVLLRTYEVHEEFFVTSFGSGGVSSCHNSPPHKRVCSGEDKSTDYEREKGVISVNSKHAVDLTHEGNQVPELNKQLDLSVSVKESFAKSHLKKGRSRGEEALPSMSAIVARPESETKGHTGYLTFARRTV